MKFLATLPGIVMLRSEHAYHCIPCRRVDTIRLE